MHLRCIFASPACFTGGGAIPGGESDDNDELDELDSEQLEVAQQALYADWSERASLL